MSRSFGHWKASATNHAPWEDAFGITVGVLLCALAVAIYAQLGMVTGGVAGIALVVHYATGVPVDLAFFGINLPFYALAVIRMGWAFTLKTFAAVAVLSFLIRIQPTVISFEAIDPFAGAVLSGVLLGLGLLAVFRHRASLGGVGILALYIQDRFGWRAGLVQLAVDLMILASALAVTSLYLVGLSVISAVILNLLLAVNHRDDRYVAR
ncbi:MAG: YitT family protein [Pseudomonadota bacterium]